LKTLCLKNEHLLILSCNIAFSGDFIYFSSMFLIPFSSLTNEELSLHAAEKLAMDLSDWEQEIWQFINNWMNPSIDYINVFTSGSTGFPKEIKHCKGVVLNSARLTCNALQLKPGDKALLCLPANKISGMMMIVRSIWSKMDLYCIRPSADPLSDIPVKEKIELAAFTPMQLFAIDKDPKKRKRVEKISKIIIGGDEIPAKLVNSIRDMKNMAYATFGMTETISHIALRTLNGQSPDNAFTTLPGITVSTDEGDRLVIEAPELGVRHLVTNDVVNLISSTKFHWLGRKDNLINSGGVKLFPEQIEEHLKTFLKIPFFITGIESPRSGQEVAIAIERKTFTRTEANDLKKQFETLSKLETPKAILTIPEFTRTDTGKIKRSDSLQHVAMKIAL
jgi:o-succinylbenzoate---CoA ligase